MYNSQSIANRIKSTAKSKGISLKTMFSDCELGRNMIFARFKVYINHFRIY